MEVHEIAAILAATLFGLLALFQILLAAGLPLGRAAWGGKYRVLPWKLRLNSLVAVGVLGAAGWVVLARADLVAPGAGSSAIRIANWVFVGYLTLNTLANATSKSKIERYVMTPISTILVVCLVIVALS